ncbi:uncharacterized protein LOC129742230 isoform X1 [Uranotaenia lowii]|uniref:uncharacterized protein LOC129742230 isoform X1 n=1 Tax=Uranotaenia lowii TaxID=190385 RepID=UPI0024796D53|nr:uncharacterized protein LOC129742230 isoform X1 [Uranotaenia lowii]
MNLERLLYVENIPNDSVNPFTEYLKQSVPTLSVHFLTEKRCTSRSVAAFVRVANDEDVGKILNYNQDLFMGKRLFVQPAAGPPVFKADHTVIVRNITNKINEEALFDHFKECGNIFFLQIRTDDFAYIAFHEPTAAKLAMGKNNLPLKGSSLKVQILTRTLDIMIVNPSTLGQKFPQLFKEMCAPLIAAQIQQQQQNQSIQQTKVPNQQQQNKPQQQQIKPQQQVQQHKPQQQQQVQQQKQNNYPQQQQAQGNSQHKWSLQQQNLSQQPQIQNQPNNPGNYQIQSQPKSQRPQPQKPVSITQLLKEKATVLQKQTTDHASTAPETIEVSKPAEEPQQKPVNPIVVDEIMIIDSDSDEEVQSAPAAKVPSPTVDLEDDSTDAPLSSIPDVVPPPPIPSKYEPGPDDIVRPVKASEIKMMKSDPKGLFPTQSVWVNNIPPETTTLELVTYLEQFGEVTHCRVAGSKNCFFTKWAKVVFQYEASADRASEYFLHPFNGRYLFVLPFSRYVSEDPERCLVIDYLSKYLTFEDVAKAFKHIGTCFYISRVPSNESKVRLFFVGDIDRTAGLEVSSIEGIPIKVENYVPDMNMMLTREEVKKFILEREICDEARSARLANIMAIHKNMVRKQVTSQNKYHNPDPAKNPVELAVFNVPKTVTDDQVKKLFSSLGDEPTGIRREMMPFDDTEKVFVGFRTISLVLRAAELTSHTKLDGNNLFFFAAWTRPALSQHSTLLLGFKDFISVQSIYDGLKKHGVIRNVTKSDHKNAIVVFESHDLPLLHGGLDQLKTISGVELISKNVWENKEGAPKNAEKTIVVIDDDDDQPKQQVVQPNPPPAPEICRTPRNEPAQQNRQNNSRQQSQNRQQEAPWRRNERQFERRQTRPNDDNRPFGRNQNRNQGNHRHFGDSNPRINPIQPWEAPMNDQRGPDFASDQFRPFEQFQQQPNHPFDQGPVNQGPFNQGPFDQGPFNQGPFNQGPFNQGPVNQGPFNQMDQFQHRDFPPRPFNSSVQFEDSFDQPHSFEQNPFNPMGQPNRFSPPRRFDNRFENQFEDRVENRFEDRFENRFDDRFGNRCDDRFENRSEQRFEDRLDNRFENQFEDRFGVRPDHREFHRNQYSPINNFDQGRREDSDGDMIDVDIPSNIPDEEIDEYIMRKQQAIKRRLEQLDAQLISSVEATRQPSPDNPPLNRLPVRGRNRPIPKRPNQSSNKQKGTIFQDNGDVMYVPNPAALKHERKRHSSQGAGKKDAKKQHFMKGYRYKNVFAGVEMVPIRKEGSGSPEKETLEPVEDNFTDQFNAAWN